MEKQGESGGPKLREKAVIVICNIIDYEPVKCLLRR